ncbi:MAG: tripartite tricarboxylate transporter substrate-binding protein [Xanthobacteraceae bacterium]
MVKSPPDGHTLLISSVGLAANPLLYKRLPFNTLSDLAPITLIASSPTILVVPTALPVNNVAEFVAYLKAKPGELNYASYGVGSSPHLATELFQSMTGTKVVHIPYSGGGPAAVGVIGNNVQMLFSSVLPVLGLVKGGQLKPIAIAADKRSPLLPDVPTFAEGGVDYKFSTWFGLLAPAKTPADIIATLNRNTVETLQEPTVRARIAEQGAEVVANSPDEFRAFIKAEMDRLGAVIRNSKIQLD